MPKARKKNTRWDLIIILVVATALTLTIFKFLSPTPQSPSIFLVDSPSLTYGNVTLSGVLQQDALTPSSFILVTNSNLVVPLDVSGVDKFVGSRVVISGLRLPLDPETGTKDLVKVSTLTLE